jgi:hypothetical protein
VKSDWLRNIQAHPEVEIRVKARMFRGRAQVVTDPIEIADFLELRLRRHPRMVGLILRAQGYPAASSRQQLEKSARGLALVIIRPEDKMDR